MNQSTELKHVEAEPAEPFVWKLSLKHMNFYKLQLESSKGHSERN